MLADPVRPPIVKLAAKAKLPVVYQYPGYVDLGALARYGPEFNAILRKGATLQDAFAGAVPSETPVEQPVVFELVVNLKAAKELGISVPEKILLRGRSGYRMIHPADGLCHAPSRTVNFGRHPRDVVSGPSRPCRWAERSLAYWGIPEAMIRSL